MKRLAAILLTALLLLTAGSTNALAAGGRSLTAGFIRGGLRVGYTHCRHAHAAHCETLAAHDPCGTCGAGHCSSFADANLDSVCDNCGVSHCNGTVQAGNSNGAVQVGTDNSSGYGSGHHNSDWSGNGHHSDRHQGHHS